MLKIDVFLYLVFCINEVQVLASKNLLIIERNIFEISYVDLKFLICFLHFLFIYNPGKFWFIITVIFNLLVFSFLVGTEFSCLSSGVDYDFFFLIND